jgi:hypothetical protein
VDVALRVVDSAVGDAEHLACFNPKVDQLVRFAVGVDYMADRFDNVP